ncbi:MAG: hypothetical protein ACC682_00105 [Gemmatimonadota bacterium]
MTPRPVVSGSPLPASSWMLPSTILASLTCMAAFEFARRFRVYDYRTFFQHLLGSGWVTYEIGSASSRFAEPTAAAGDAAGAGRA